MQYLRINLENQEQLEQVRQLCSKHKVAIPSSKSITFGAFDESGRLIGVASIKLIHQVEPLVVDEGYPRVSQILGEKAMAVISTVTNEVTALVKGAMIDYIAQLEKYGFVITDDTMTVLKKKV